MATYLELAGIRNETDWGPFFEKVAAATQVKAAAVISQTSPTAEAIAWAQTALVNPNAAADSLVNYIVAINKSFAISVILSASDSQIQTNIDIAVNAIYGAGA